MPFKARVSLRGTGQFNVFTPPRNVGAVPFVVAVAELSGTHLPLNSRVTPEGFEAKWQTTDSARRASRPPRDRRTVMWKAPLHRHRCHPGDADLPHDQSRGEVRAVVHCAVVRHLFLFRSTVAAAHPCRAVRVARFVAVAVLSAAALARRTDRLHQRLSRVRRPRARCNPPSTRRRSRAASCRRSCSP